jgi:coproporphyrinogen III oxidase-like Fe-S oxidoreductase
LDKKIVVVGLYEIQNKIDSIRENIDRVQRIGIDVIIGLADDTAKDCENAVIEVLQKEHDRLLDMYLKYKID